MSAPASPPVHPAALAHPGWAKAHPSEGEFIDSGLSRMGRMFSSAHSGTDAVAELAAAISSNDIVVVGMKFNPFVSLARSTLDKAGLAYKYCEYGGYFSQYQARFAIKKWSGWSTIPQVFVKGQLIGGADLTLQLTKSGELAKMLKG
jgi:monothiol glutaredoxin